MPSWMNLCFQDPSSMIMSELSSFNDHVMSVMCGIIVLIVYVMSFMMGGNKFYKNLSEGTMIEMIWSIVPAFLLIVLVLPSMKVLYLMEDVKMSVMTFKIIAHQWYWSYVVPLYKNFYFLFFGSKLLSGYEYDSIMSIENEDSPRLLGCDNELFLPYGITSRLMISSSDVIHSFAVPSLGLKVDALPGRINQLFVNPSRIGVFYGQCSEICGSNHSFMPIEVKVVSLEVFDCLMKEFLFKLFEDEEVVCKGLEELS